ncbi:hypothetical protein Bbelb_297830 [Branchiostoma belcheri]|nr:hypothetical protein Bbelb_297830 [Branchiostoma belcheri]
MGLQSFSSSGADSRRDEDVEREGLSPDTGEQDDTSSEDELDESGYMEVSSDRVSQQEDKLILTGMEELFSAQEEKIDQRFDKFEKQMDQKLRQRNEDIKASLFDVSSHLTDIKQALGEQEAMRGKVSDLQERVRDLLIHEIDQTTIKGEIKDIERKVVELQGGYKEIHDGLTQMNEQLEKMLSTLEPSSKLLRKWRKEKVDKPTVKALAQACRDVGLFTLADEISGISGGPSRADAGTLPPIQDPRGIRDATRETWPRDSEAASGAIPKKKK